MKTGFFSAPLLTIFTLNNSHFITYHEDNVQSPIRTYPIIALHEHWAIFHVLELSSTNQIPFCQTRLRFISCHFLVNNLHFITYSTWLEIEDIMAAKHAHKKQITELKYGGCIRLSVGKFWKSDSNFLEACTKNALVWNIFEECPDHSPPFSNSFWCPKCLKMAHVGQLKLLLQPQQGLFYQLPTSVRSLRKPTF